MIVSMARSEVIGTCRICRFHGPLSFEHVPPKKAFNNRPVVRARIEQIVRPEPWDGKTGTQVQRGSGANTLCERCNNLTGHWYGDEYVRWAHRALEVMDNIPVDDELAFRLRFRGKPLRFLKQVITMMFSANGPEFASFHPELVAFVLQKSKRYLPPQYAVDLVLVRGSLARSVGVFSLLSTNRNEVTIASEVAHYPFAFQLYFGGPPVGRHGPIEQFGQYTYDEEVEVTLQTIAGHVSTKFPGDYRSRDRVEREARASDRLLQETKTERETR